MDAASEVLEEDEELGLAIVPKFSLEPHDSLGIGVSERGGGLLDAVVASTAEAFTSFLDAVSEAKGTKTDRSVFFFRIVHSHPHAHQAPSSNSLGQATLIRDGGIFAWRAQRRHGGPNR